jgi:NAD(P)-dependent dehydrogenase (short-subunit alcohol dehydrogenase family)
MTTENRLAVVTGASRGIRYELARIAAAITTIC